jgi:hypothetical protein
MHLRMQDDQISQKFIGLTPADMDRLPHLINTEKKFLVVNNLVHQLGLHLLALFYKRNNLLLLIHSPSTMDICRGIFSSLKTANRGFEPHPWRKKLRNLESFLD